MTALCFTSHSSLSSCNLHTHHYKKKHGFNFNNLGSNLSTIINKTQSSNPGVSIHFSVNRRHFPLICFVKDEQATETEPTAHSPVAVESKELSDETHGPNSEETEGKEDQQEMDWKTDEEFKRFMGNPSIEAAIKLEKKRADRKLKELDRESNGNAIVGLFNKVVRDNLAREKERLEQAEETFKALDLNKVRIKKKV